MDGFIVPQPAPECKVPAGKKHCWLPKTFALQKHGRMHKKQKKDYLRKQHNDIDIDTIYDIPDKDNKINEIIDRNTYNKMIDGLEKKEKEIVSLKVLTNFNKVFDIICLHPNIGFTKEEFIYRDVRLFVVKKKFLIVYKELDSCIHILRVLNTCQDICFKL